MKPIFLKCANLIGETGLYRALRPGRLPVFLLHRVRADEPFNPGETPASVLRDYLKYLSVQNFRVLNADTLCDILKAGRPIPPKSVMFTIDDGFHDHFDVAASIFDEFDFPLNCFVITGFLDRALWPWDDQVSYAINNSVVSWAEIVLPSGNTLVVDRTSGNVRQATRMVRNALKGESQDGIYGWLEKELYRKLQVEFPEEIPADYRPMSWDDARRLRAKGHGVYPHTVSHRILSTLSLEQKQREITEARQRVAEELDIHSEVFAYPTGRRADYDSVDVKLLKQAGFHIAFSSVPDYVQSDVSRFDLPRFSLPLEKENFLQIINRFEALKSSLPRSAETNRKLLASR